MAGRPLLLVAADPEEDAMVELLSGIPGTQITVSQENETTFHRAIGVPGADEICVVRCEQGSGNPGAAQDAAGQAIRDLRPDKVVVAGIACGDDPAKDPIGTVLVATAIIPYEHARAQPAAAGRGAVAAAGRGAEVGRTRFEHRQPPAPVDAALLQRARTLRRYWEQSELRFGDILSGEKLLDDPDLKDALFGSFRPRPIGLEMEGAGAYTAAVRNKKPWILVKAVCDYGVSKGEGDEDARQRVAAGLAARFARALVCDEAIPLSPTVQIRPPDAAVVAEVNAKSLRERNGERLAARLADWVSSVLVRDGLRFTRLRSVPADDGHWAVAAETFAAGERLALQVDVERDAGHLELALGPEDGKRARRFARSLDFVPAHPDDAVLATAITALKADLVRYGREIGSG